MVVVVAVGHLPKHKNVGSPAYCVGSAGARSAGSRYGHFCSTVWHTLRQGRILRRLRNSNSLRFDLKIKKKKMFFKFQLFTLNGVVEKL